MDYFKNPQDDGGLPRDYISDPAELRQLTSFFAWAAWTSVADRPGRNYSYTNNFPYDPAVGNLPTSGAVRWSALSLITLPGATAAVLFAFVRFDFLGWRRRRGHVHPKMLPGVATPSQRATIKYFAIVALLFLAQALVGAGTAHHRVDAGSFYGIDLAALLPSQILRMWHLQLAIFWIAASYVAGGLFLAPSIGGHEPRAQYRWVTVLFVALVLVVVGSLLGEFAGVHHWMGRLWSWFGDQGWEMPRPRTRMADNARCRSHAVGRAIVPRYRTAAERSRIERAFRPVHRRGGHDPGLLRARVLFEHHVELHRSRSLAILGHPPLG
jgi:nitric oxide reductase subunit B